MSQSLTDLEPKSLWSHFAGLNAVPRPSKKEEQAVAWALAIAEQHGWEIRRDEVGNLVFAVPATPGHEQAPIVVIQGHLDMVCEKRPDVVHDFDRDPIRTVIDGEWVRADGTTLGADNGIGVAAALAAATDESVVHGPLELLLTLDEETGLTGAAGLDGSILKGRTMLNLDSEDDGVLFVGCAGGSDCRIDLSTPQQPVPPGYEGLRVAIGGLRGGHSGLNIDENRGNAIKLLSALLPVERLAAGDIGLAAIEGGSMHNAIPRDAAATLVGSQERLAALRESIDGRRAGMKAALSGIDDGLTIECTPCEAPGQMRDAAQSATLVRLLRALPHGVLGMSPAIPGLVETSNNVAVIEDHGDRVCLVTSARSSVAEYQRGVTESVRAAAALAGAGVAGFDGYPGWKPDMNSPVLAVTREVFRRIWDREPEVTAVHAGLECGLLGEKVPGMDMISFGPTIQGAHSPDERVSIPSVARFWKAVKMLLESLA